MAPIPTSPQHSARPGRGAPLPDRVNNTRSRRVSRSGPPAVTRTVSLNDMPRAPVYMWNTMPGSSTQSAVGRNARVKSLVRGGCVAP